MWRRPNGTNETRRPDRIGDLKRSSAMSDKTHRTIIWLTVAVGVGLIVRMFVEAIRFSS